MIGSLKMVGIETLKSKYRSFKKINCRIVNKIFFFFLWLLKVFFLLKHFLTVDKIPKTVKFDRIKKKKKIMLTENMHSSLIRDPVSL